MTQMGARKPQPKPALKSGALTLNRSAGEKPHPLAPKSDAGAEAQADTGSQAQPARKRPARGSSGSLPEDTAMLSARVPVSLRNQFKAKAAENGMPVDAVVRLLIQRYVDGD